MNFKNQSVKYPLGKELLNLTIWSHHHNQLISQCTFQALNIPQSPQII